MLKIMESIILNASFCSLVCLMRNLFYLICRTVYSRAKSKFLDSMTNLGASIFLYDRIYACSTLAIKDIVHILFVCELHALFRLQCFKSICERIAHWDLNLTWSYFLLGSNIYIVSRTAKFTDKAVQLRIILNKSGYHVEPMYFNSIQFSLLAK